MKVGRWHDEDIFWDKLYVRKVIYHGYGVEKKNTKRQSHIQYIHHVLLYVSIHFNILRTHPPAIDSSFHVESHICSFYNFVSINFIFLMTFFSCMTMVIWRVYIEKKKYKKIYISYIHTSIQYKHTHIQYWTWHSPK